MSEQEKIRIGEQLAEILILRRVNKQKGNENIFYKTTWGTKTPLGIYETVKRILENKG